MILAFLQTLWRKGWYYLLMKAMRMAGLRTFINHHGWTEEESQSWGCSSIWHITDIWLSVVSAEGQNHQHDGCAQLWAGICTTFHVWQIRGRWESAKRSAVWRLNYKLNSLSISSHLQMLQFWVDVLYCGWFDGQLMVLCKTSSRTPLTIFSVTYASMTHILSLTGIMTTVSRTSRELGKLLVGNMSYWASHITSISRGVSHTDEE